MTQIILALYLKEYLIIFAAMYIYFNDLLCCRCAKELQWPCVHTTLFSLACPKKPKQFLVQLYHESRI